MSAGLEVGYNIALVIISAVVLGFLARKTRQPTIIAYILTGMILGPLLFNVTSRTEITGLFSELGLGFLLFLIGLEIELKEIRDIFRPTLLIATGQIALSWLLGFLIGFLFEFGFVESVFIGFAVALSSTAVVVKMLSDRDETSTLHGKLDVGILLVQDMAVVILLGLMTINTASLNAAGLQVVELVALMGLIAGIAYASSHLFLNRLFNVISENQHGFFVHGIAWALVLMTVASELNLSPEIGAFIAGISLGQLPYSSELRERVRPLTDFFMAVFFIEFGLGLTPETFGLFGKAVIASLIFMAGKFLILFVLIDRAKFTPETSFRTSLNLTQISEFSLILVAVGASSGLIGQQVSGFVALVALFTMAGSSYLISYSSEIYERTQPVLEVLDSEEKQDVEIRGLEDHALVLGYSELAKRTLPVLKERYDQVMVVDRNSANTRELANSKYEYIYGDFKHGEIRKASGIKKADIVVSFSPERWVNEKILEDKSGEAVAFLRAQDVDHAAELYEMGANFVIVKNLMAADKLNQYLRLYLEDPELFRAEIDDEVELIRWGGRSV